MKKVLFFISLSFVGLCSCTQNITLDLPAYHPKVAVYCMLSPGKPFKMYLNLSKSYYNYADTIAGYRFIKNARVIITDQTANKIDTLHLDSAYEGNAFTMTWFYLNNSKVNAGDHYIANILYEGQTLSAETTVPYAVTPDYVTYKKVTSPFQGFLQYEFHVFFKDRAGEANSYSLSAEIPGSQHNVQNNNNFTSDAGFDGKQMELVNTNGSPNGMDTFSISFSINNATRQTDKYLTDLYNQQYGNQDPFSEPVIMESNITGGLGLFGAISPSPSFVIKVK